MAELAGKALGKVWVGMDVHKRKCVMTMLDEKGLELGDWEMLTNSKEIEHLIDILPPETSIALEASTVGKAIFHRLRDSGMDIHMGSPRELKAITTSDVKTDKHDSYHLGNLLRTNYFPECYVPPKDIERIRDLVRFRMNLGQQVSGVKNQIHALVSRNLFDFEMSKYSDRFGKSGLERLIKLPFSEQDRTILKAYLEQLTILIRQEEDISQELAKIGNAKREVQILMSIPGIDFYGAVGILGEIGDIRRFADKKKLYSYAGLVPKADNSGDRESKHRRVKRGNSVLKFFLCSAVLGAIRASSPNSVSKFYNKKAKQIGGGKAQVAAARKLSGIVWKILTSGQQYTEEDPALTHRKVSRMNRMAKSPEKAVTDEELMAMATEIGNKQEVLKRLSPDPEEEE